MDDLIVEQLMQDKLMNEAQAIELFYNSKTFELLSDTSIELHKKTWKEIYEILKEELNTGLSQ